MSRRAPNSITQNAGPALARRGSPSRRRPRSDDGNAFIPDPEGGPARSSDDLAENLAEEFVQGATSGEAVAEEQNDEVVPEELGGPFVETSAREEFAEGVDESNPVDAEPAALPLSGRGIVARSREEIDQETESDEEPEE